jgi:hypothetical protein
MARVQETATDLAYDQWDGGRHVPLVVSFGGTIAMDSISRNRVLVSVGEDPSLPPTDEGYTVSVTSQPPNSVILVSGGGDLTVRPKEGCQSVQVKFPPHALQTHEVAGDASLAPAPDGGFEGHIAALTEASGGNATDRLTLQLGGIAVTPAA